MFNKKFKKSFSPVIAVILLFLTTVVISVLMFNFTQNYVDETQNSLS